MYKFYTSSGERRHFDLIKASQSGWAAPAALFAALGTDGKKEAIFSLNSVSWKRQEGILFQRVHLGVERPN